MSDKIITPIICKTCGSANVVKFGTYDGEQRYWCKGCQTKFKNDDSLYGGRVPAADIASAMLEYYSGLSVNDIRRRILQEKGYEPAQSTVYQWIDKFTTKAVDYYNQFKPEVGDVWVADETAVSLDGDRKIWLWSILDADTRFVLASKLSYTRTSDDAYTLLELARKRAGKHPKVVLTDKLNLYPEAISKIYGKETTHTQSSPFEKVDSTRLIERWHETIKERTKVLYALRNTESALAFLDGFIAYYNFIRPHEGIDNQRPAEAAKIKYDVKSWADVTHLGEREPEPFEPQYVIPVAVQMARVNTMGVPKGKPGRKRGETYEQTAQKIAAREREKKSRAHKAKIKANRSAGYKKATHTIMQAMLISQPKRRQK